jgi:hypothetical protein
LPLLNLNLVTKLHSCGDGKARSCCSLNMPRLAILTHDERRKMRMLYLTLSFAVSFMNFL